MARLIIKIGYDMRADIKQVFDAPQKAAHGSHALYLRSTKDLQEILSPKRLELLQHIIESRGESVNDASKKLKRKQEAVSRDAGILAFHGLISKKKKAQKTLLEPNYDCLQINLKA